MERVRLFSCTPELYLPKWGAHGEGKQMDAAASVERADFSGASVKASES